MLMQDITLSLIMDQNIVLWRFLVLLVLLQKCNKCIYATHGKGSRKHNTDQTQIIGNLFLFGEKRIICGDVKVHSV